jgi:hypothetical protein
VCGGETQEASARLAAAATTAPRRQRRENVM